MKVRAFRPSANQLTKRHKAERNRPKSQTSQPLKTKTNSASRLLLTTSQHSHCKWMALSAIGLTALCSSPKIQAAVIITLQQVGSDVVANGSGTINTSALTLSGSGSAQSSITPSNPSIILGPASPQSGAYSLWQSVTMPSLFGVGNQTFATSGSGDVVGTAGIGLFLPQAYVSGAALSDTATWANQTFSSLGVTPGTYTWTWGSGPTADSLTLNATVAPEPASAVLLLGGGALLALRRRRD